MKHIVFYDGDCGFCQKSLQVLIKLDKKKVFAFASLKGETAKNFNIREKETFILCEQAFSSPRYWSQGRGVFRVFWLLGGCKKVLGIFHYLPALFLDPFYQWIAKNRYRFAKNCQIVKDSRFLP